MAGCSAASQGRARGRGGLPALDSDSLLRLAGRVRLVDLPGVRVRALERLALGEAPEAEGPDVHRLRLAVEDQLGQARADRGGDLEAGAAERGGHVEAVAPLDPGQERVPVAA